MREPTVDVGTRAREPGGRARAWARPWTCCRPSAPWPASSPRTTGSWTVTTSARCSGARERAGASEMMYYRSTGDLRRAGGPVQGPLRHPDRYGGDPPVPHDPPLLYDLEADPSEKFDVAARHPEVIERIREAVEAHRKHGRGRSPTSWRYFRSSPETGPTPEGPAGISAHEGVSPRGGARDDSKSRRGCGGRSPFADGQCAVGHDRHRPRRRARPGPGPGGGLRRHRPLRRLCPRGPGRSPGLPWRLRSREPGMGARPTAPTRGS